MNQNLVDAMEKQVDADLVKRMQNEYHRLSGKKAEEEEMQNEIYNRILAEHEFFADEGKTRYSRYEGTTRILDAEIAFLMKDADYAAYQRLVRKEFAGHGLTDGQGRFTRDAGKRLSALKRKIVSFMIPLLPECEEKKDFRQAARNGEAFDSRVSNELVRLFLQLKVRNA